MSTLPDPATTQPRVSPPTADDAAGAGQASPRDAIEARAREALARGDHRAALTVLMDGYGADIYGFCRQFTGDPQLAEDLRQIIFIQAFEALPGLTLHATLRAWLYGIARHRCLDATKIRRRWRKRFHLDDAPADRAAAPGQDPAEALDQPALQRALAYCLSKLAPELRMLVLMRYREDLSYVELARAFGAQPATLQARVSRAMPGLRRCVSAQGVSP